VTDVTEIASDVTDATGRNSLQTSAKIGRKPAKIKMTSLHASAREKWRNTVKASAKYATP
jgi:hypothetical protein